MKLTTRYPSAMRLRGLVFRDGATQVFIVKGRLCHNRNDAALARVKANADHRAERLRPLLSELRAAGITGLIPTAAELNQRQIATPPPQKVASDDSRPSVSSAAEN